MLESFFTWMGSWFVNTLSWWQWAILAAVPPAIIALYFLKLKRQPLEVPSTYLWHKSIEDLHVNSIWQRLRRNLLLFLQLLLLLLVMLALLRPSWQARQLDGKRFIFLIDNSASMQATDVGPSRLEEAKRQVAELIDQMKSGDAAMIVSFADTARVEQTFTDDRRQLHRSLNSPEKIQPTPRRTSLLEALKVASGLANPGAITEEGSEFEVAEALPAQLFIFSDGRFGPVTGFSLGNLKPVFVPIGRPDAANVAIVAFAVRQSEADPELFQAFARLENYGEEDVDVSVELFLDDRMINADRVAIEAGGSGGVKFDLGAVQSGVLRLKATTGDDLALDDEAWTVVEPPRRANVLLVTTGNEPLELALKTAPVVEKADVQIEPPGFLKEKTYADKAVAGEYDLVIYDRCQPQKVPPADAALMPRANTLFIGSLPPEGGWSRGPVENVPDIIDYEAAHPLLQWIYLSNVTLLEGTPLTPPPGGGVLIDSNKGPMLAIAPRQRFEDAVLGFAILDEVTGPDGQKKRVIGTDWMARQSFPVFVLNVVDYFGGSRNALESGGLRPGRPVTLEVPAAKGLRVRTPADETFDLKREESGKATFTGTDELGIYDIQSGRETFQQFVVNLFDPAESNIRPEVNPVIKIGYVDVAGEPGWKAARREIWKGLLLLGLVVLLLEWYIYNRRVYL